MSERDESDELLGYRRPPSWARYRKGESGNPKGRPRKGEKQKPPAPPATPESEFDAMIERIANREMAATERGVERTIAVKEAVMTRVMADAMKGNPQSQRLAIQAIQGAEERNARRAAMAAAEAEQARKEQAEEDERTYRYICELRRIQTQAWERAPAMGSEEPDNPWPHPEDLFIDEDKRTWRVRGPLYARSVPDWEEAREERDYHLAEMVLSIRLRQHKLIGRIYLVNMLRLDIKLPKRWQIAHDMEPASEALMAKPLARHIGMVEHQRAERELRSAGQPLSRENYRELNTIFKPAYNLLGYRSLRQFQRACDENGGVAPPRPSLLKIPSSQKGSRRKKQ